jgi:hypothetical protein
MAWFIVYMDTTLHREATVTSDSGESHSASRETHEVVEYDADTGTYRATYDSSTESVCMAIISTVAAVSETDPSELEPLYPVINPDALNALFSSKQDGRSRTGGEVRFTYCGYEITATSNSDVQVAPTEQ